MCAFVFCFLYFTAVDDCNVSNHKPYEWLKINFDCRRENGLLRILICIPEKSWFFFFFLLRSRFKYGSIWNILFTSKPLEHPTNCFFTDTLFHVYTMLYIIQIREHYSRTLQQLRFYEIGFDDVYTLIILSTYIYILYMYRICTKNVLYYNRYIGAYVVYNIIVWRKYKLKIFHPFAGIVNNNHGHRMHFFLLLIFSVYAMFYIIISFVHGAILRVDIMI